MTSTRKSFHSTRKKCVYTNSSGIYIPCDPVSLSGSPIYITPIASPIASPVVSPVVSPAVSPVSISDEKITELGFEDSEKVRVIIRNGNIKELRNFMNRLNISPDVLIFTKRNQKIPILCEAQYRSSPNNPTIFKFLLDSGANPNILCGVSPLLFQHQEKDHDNKILKLMLKYNADPDIRDTRERTLLHHLVGYKDEGDFERAKILLEAGANPNILDGKGETVLDMIINGKKGNDDAADYVELLLNYGANPNINPLTIFGPVGRNPQSVETRLEILKMLLFNKENPADPNVKLELFNGFTPLMAAIHNINDAEFRYDAVKEYLKAEANPNEQDAKGETALMKAARKNDKKTIELLLKYNADPNIMDNEGKQAIDLIPEKMRSDYFFLEPRITKPARK